MLKTTVLTAALAAAFGFPFAAWASDQDLAKIRAEIKEMKQGYEARIQALEKRVRDAEAKSEKQDQLAAAPATTPAPVPVQASAAPSASGFNPSIGLVLGGHYARIKKNPEEYRLQGFIPGGEIGPGARSFNLGESELSIGASVDPYFSGKLTVGLAPDNSASVEEAYVQTSGLSNGISVKGGRFLSSIGYLNNQHGHTQDFVDAPLTYQAFLGGQYRPDGLQLKWLAPTDRFLEFGLEAGNGGAFPGSDRNKNGVGSVALFAHVGDDIGANASWRAGVSYLRTKATDRTYDDVDLSDTTVTNAFTGTSNTLIVDGVYKWAPNGNATQTNFKLQGEYFRRRESGSLTYDTTAQSLGTASGSYASAQSGWYLQGVYQFMPKWRTGLRFDKLNSGGPSIGLVNSGTLAAGDFSNLTAYNPTRASVMLDYSPSEFSRLRLQFAQEKSRPGVIDNQIYLQYIMSLGAHGAHAF